MILIKIVIKQSASLLRKNKGFTQEEPAGMIGVTSQAVSRINDPNHACMNEQQRKVFVYG